MKRKPVSGARVALISVMILLVGLGPIAFSSTIAGQRTKALVIRSGGNVLVITPPGVDVGVYWDTVCGNSLSSIDWGSIDPGSSNDNVIYIRNEGDSDITLYLDTADWEPNTASSYLTLSWDYDGEQISPNEVIQATLTLEVSDTIEGVDSFSFDIIITCEEVDDVVSDQSTEPTEDQPTEPAYQTVDVHEANSMLYTFTYIVDVRPKDVCLDGHLPWTKWPGKPNHRGIPFDELETLWTILEPAKDEPILIYDDCGCYDSVMACEFLVEKGFTQIYFLEGGFEAWEAAGYKVSYCSKCCDPYGN